MVFTGRRRFRSRRLMEVRTARWRTGFRKCASSSAVSLPTIVLTSQNSIDSLRRAFSATERSRARKDLAMKRLLLVFVAGCVLTASTDLSTGPVPLPAASGSQAARAISPQNQPIVLFNGKDLTSFYTWVRDTRHEDPRRIFNVAIRRGPARHPYHRRRLRRAHHQERIHELPSRRRDTAGAIAPGAIARPAPATAGFSSTASGPTAAAPCSAWRASAPG